MGRINRVLVANRGEIAIRVMRSCRELGLETVAVYSEADRTSLHVRYADMAKCIGPAPSKESYLAIDRIIEAASATNADAVHPGYGFLSENANFVRACEAAGLTFIGPPAKAMEAMGEKTRARATMIEAGVPVVPGTFAPLTSLEEAKAEAGKVGYPVMLKAAGGGGGKGMRRVSRAGDLESAWRASRSEASSSFGNDAVYIEKFLDTPHHIEVQIFADKHGNCIHLNERECSAQRRNQKVVEETPSPIISPSMRHEMGEVAVRAAKAVGYVGAGTVEFLVDASRHYYFLEMNTRLQVEHPVTEWVTGLDLVAWQIHVAGGGALPSLEPIPPRGHAVEVRIYAEDPAANFMPSPGRITHFRTPGGPFVRDDSGAYAGYTVPTMYDPMISKLSAWAPTRVQAIARMKRALEEFEIEGITTNIAYLKAILEHPSFVKGDYDTGLLTVAHQELIASTRAPQSDAVLIAAAVRAHRQTEVRQQAPSARDSVGSWRFHGRRGASWRSS